jgi:hypothetical protein
MAVDAHEDVHVVQDEPFAGRGTKGFLEWNTYIANNQGKLEVPAYDKKIEFLTNYLDTLSPPQDVRNAIQGRLNWITLERAAACSKGFGNPFC